MLSEDGMTGAEKEEKKAKAASTIMGEKNSRRLLLLVQESLEVETGSEGLVY